MRTPIGRKRLAEELAIGEGSARTLVNYLKDSGLATSDRSGFRTTKEGSALLSKLGIVPLHPIGGLKVAECAFCVKVTPSRSVGKGFEQRDAAVRSGGAGATTIVCKNGKMRFAGEEEDAECRYSELAKMRKGMSEGDVLIVGSASTQKKAEEATILAAMTLVDLPLSEGRSDEPFQTISSLLDCIMILRTSEGSVAYKCGCRIEGTSRVVEKSWMQKRSLKETERTGEFKGMTIRTAHTRLGGREAIIAIAMENKATRR